MDADDVNRNADLIDRFALGILNRKIREHTYSNRTDRYTTLLPVAANKEGALRVLDADDFINPDRKGINAISGKQGKGKKGGGGKNGNSSGQQKSGGNRNDNNRGGNESRGTKRPADHSGAWCDMCDKPNHTRQQCYHMKNYIKHDYRSRGDRLVAELGHDFDPADYLGPNKDTQGN